MTDILSQVKNCFIRVFQQAFLIVNAVGGHYDALVPNQLGPVYASCILAGQLTGGRVSVKSNIIVCK